MTGEIRDIVGIVAPMVFTLLALWLLVYYRKNRKFPKDRVKTWKGMIESNVIELIFGAVLIPDIAGMILAQL